MTHTEKDLKNKKQEDIIYYIFIGVLIMLSLLQIYNMLFIIQPTKGDFGTLLLGIWLAVILYLVNIKQVPEKSEKRTLWKVIRCIGIIVGIIILALLHW